MSTTRVELLSSFNVASPKRRNKTYSLTVKSNLRWVDHSLTLKNYNVLHVHDIQTHTDALAARGRSSSQNSIEREERIEADDPIQTARAKLKRKRFKTLLGSIKLNFRFELRPADDQTSHGQSQALGEKRKQTTSTPHANL